MAALAEKACNRDQALHPRKWTLSIGYRYQQSDRHFSGDIENTSRPILHNQIYNLYHLLDFTLERQLTPRWSVFGSVPVLFAHRNQLYPPVAQYASNGFGDASFGVNAWVFKPPTESGNNISVGAGLKTPTGNCNVTGQARYQGQIVTAAADQSIQAGDCGWGLSINAQGYKRIPKIDTQLYVAAVYLFNPMGTNGVYTWRSFPALHNREDYMSIADQYLYRGGFSHTVPKVRGMALSFGTRMEGVPAHDVFGPSNGFRRPGYAISMDPGLLYTHRDYTFSVNGPWAVYRNRTTSVPDVQNGIHGDAAFADYTLVFGMSKRF